MVRLVLCSRHEFSHLVPYRFDSCPFQLFKATCPTASVICFMSSILRKSDPGYFLSYLRCVSTYYSRLDFVMWATHASQKSHITTYRGWLGFFTKFLWTGLLSILDLSSESPSPRAASTCTSGFSPLQHPLPARCSWRAGADVDIWSGNEKKWSFLRNGRIGERWEEGDKRVGKVCKDICEEICEKMGEKMGKKKSDDKREKRSCMFKDHVIKLWTHSISLNWYNGRWLQRSLANLLSLIISLTGLVYCAANLLNKDSI